MPGRLIDEGGDWDRRNRLKVYRGVYCMAVRDFKSAASLFLDTVATFTSYELMDYESFVTYTVLCSMIALDRPELREKVTTEIDYGWMNEWLKELNEWMNDISRSSKFCSLFQAVILNISVPISQGCPIYVQLLGEILILLLPLFHMIAGG